MTKIATVAIFDLDYTLTKRGTWGRFVWKTVKLRPHLWAPLLLTTLSFQINYKRGHIPRGAVKKNMMRWSMQKLPRHKLERMAANFAINEINKGIRPGGIAALEYHKAQGHQILIASAAVDLVVHPIADGLGVEDYVSTELAWTEEGYLKEDFASKNCYGEAKLERVKAYLKSLGLENARTYFYSDSKADLPVLEFANCPVVVDPSEKFEKIAIEKSMPIQNWMSDSSGFMALEIK